MTDIASINLWHKRARPEPTDRDFRVSLGVHFEEVAEMLDALEGADVETRFIVWVLQGYVKQLAEGLKTGEYSAGIKDRKEFLDAICDQIVTAVGAAYCAHMDVVKGMDIVNTSNWSKFDENGQPLRDENGKIKKGPKYTPPHLDECV